MKFGRLFVLAAIVTGLIFTFTGSAVAQSGAVGIYSVAPCKDSTTVAVMGTSSYATNRVWARIYARNDKGEFDLLDTEYTAAFGSGRISLAIVLAYAKNSVSAGTQLRIDTQLERLGGNTWTTVGPVVSQYTVAADRRCLGSCTVTVDTTDSAPAEGTITLRSHYGTWFRPEGRLHGALPVRAWHPARVVFVGIPCGWTVRAWYYPKTGDGTPRMLPAQYWPNEFAATVADGTNPYTTAFAKGLPATDPLEGDDPFVAR
jgi:hypothetical protein